MHYVMSEPFFLKFGTFDLQFVWRLEFVTFIFYSEEKKLQRTSHFSKNTTLQRKCLCNSYANVKIGKIGTTHVI